jgi:L-Ala-D/L-Glu epimerase / N-acetyl-D-glutamate racemase
LRLALRAWHHTLLLRKPYRLSFAVLDRFETLYVSLEGEGRAGFGEITPLPGYGGETIDAARRGLGESARELAAGVPLGEIAASLHRTHPFTSSGLVCAFETWAEGESEGFSAALPGPVPLAGLCAGDTPDAVRAEARRLIEGGYLVLKMKAGRAPELEESLVRAAARELPPRGSIRLDANQAYSPDQALELCHRLEDLAAVALLEQPFRPEMWTECQRLASSTSFPIMLDESIWTAEDISRAADCGAKHVKLKLCKHPGMAASSALIEEARRRRLGIVYGNGVQTALGNHLEARVHLGCDLATATEANGFVKVEEHPFPLRLEVSGGELRDRGIGVTSKALASGRLIAETMIPRAGEEG